MFNLKNCKGRVSPDIFYRFISKIEFTDTCWFWKELIDRDGYAVFRDFKSHTKKIYRAHRASFYYMFGYLPSHPRGSLDHTCRVRHCVNPHHLQDVTIRENVLRSEGVAAINAKKTHCPKGHEYSGGNLRVYIIRSTGGYGRNCGMCQRLKDNERAAKRRSRG